VAAQEQRAREVPAFVGRGARGEGEVVPRGHLQASGKEQDGPEGDCSSPVDGTAALPPGQLLDIIVELDEETVAALGASAGNRPLRPGPGRPRRPAGKLLTGAA
jgi:hypothetical protein